MNRLPADRTTLVLLAAVVLAIAVAIIWWLLGTGRFGDRPVQQAQTQEQGQKQDRQSVEPARPAPAEQKPAQAPLAAATETLKGLGEQLAPEKPRAEALPRFDVARIEPNGDAVIAGQAAPGSTIELLRDGVVHDRALVEASGAFVLVPKPLPPGSYALTLRMTEPGGKVSQSASSVAVVLDEVKQDKPMVALVKPEAPTVVLSRPEADKDAGDAAAAAAKGEASVRVDAVEAEAGGRLYVSGKSAPGASVRLYLNDAYIAAGTAAADGRVEFSIRGGVRAGDYRVRLDQVDGAGKVLARAEVPFSAPAFVAEQADAAGAAQQRASVSIAASTTASPDAGQPNAAPGASGEPGKQAAAGAGNRSNAVVVPSIESRVVVRGDNLWRISHATYGDGKRYTVIYGANRHQIRNPHLIYPGQVFVLPKAEQ